MTRLILALILAVGFAFFDFRFRVELPALPDFAPQVAPVRAAGDDPMPLCDPIGMGGGRVIYRCIDEQEGTLIYLNDLGFMFALGW